jgi:hypothetical protein
MRDPGWRLQPVAPHELLAGMAAVRKLEVAVVLNMEEAAITDFVRHPYGLAIGCPVLH